MDIGENVIEMGLFPWSPVGVGLSRFDHPGHGAEILLFSVLIFGSA